MFYISVPDLLRNLCTQLEGIFCPFKGLQATKNTTLSFAAYTHLKLSVILKSHILFLKSMLEKKLEVYNRFVYKPQRLDEFSSWKGGAKPGTNI